MPDFGGFELESSGSAATSLEGLSFSVTGHRKGYQGHLLKEYKGYEGPPGTGPYPQYGWDFPEGNSGKIPEFLPETLSERFLEFPSRVRLGSPKHYNSKHLKAPEHFQNSLPPSTAGDASFFRSGSGEGLPEPVMAFPAVLGVCLRY